MVREYLKSIYAKFDTYIISAAKFLLTFFTLSNINSQIGAFDRLNDTAIVLLVSLVCALMPWGIAVMAAALFVLAHFYALSLELAGIMLVVFIIMFCLYLRFGTGDSIYIMVTLLLLFINMPYIIPVFTGLTAVGVTVAVPVAFGIIIYYMINFAAGNADFLGAGGSTAEEMLERFKFIIDNAFKDRLMILMIVAFTVTIALVYMIRKLAIDYAWFIAVIFGVIVNIIIMLIGKAMMDVTLSTASLILGSILSLVIMSVLQMFIFAVDYRRKVNLQFEDDAYVYYVKAVPKVVYEPGRKQKSMISGLFTKTKPTAASGKPAVKKTGKPSGKPVATRTTPTARTTPEAKIIAEAAQVRTQARPKPAAPAGNLHDEKK